jgi:UDP-N-acetylglucosamine:LPS N-acetylglucosamine transferase
MKKLNIAFISSKGGHLGQMRLIFTREVIGNNNAILITEDFKKYGKYENQFLEKYPVYYFKPDWLKVYPWRYLLLIIQLAKIFRKEKINIIITNGAQISIPAVLAAKILRIRSIFMETIIRVKTTTWCGKFCYYFCDRFLVQHKEMIEKYGKKSEYHGGVL